LIKDYPNKYSVDSATIGKLGLDEVYDPTEELRDQVDLMLKDGIELKLMELGVPVPALRPTDLDSTRAEFAAYHGNLATLRPHFTDAQFSRLDQQLSEFRSSLDGAGGPAITWGEIFLEQLLQWVPNFILFSSFDDVFPNEVSFADLTSNTWINDLARISNLDPEIIRGTNRNARVTHKNALNVSLNQDFKQFWTQDLSSLVIDWDSEKIEFWIKENDHFYPPNLRSQGRRWHLAFYIRVSARARDDVINVIRIDEPGLYLHAKAQRDILSHLEASSEDCQVMFSTHSPYLIESDKLDRIRLVQRVPNLGTTIENKVYAVSDKETLTPILSAIGLELSQGIIAGDRVNNLIVEGMSDYYYVTAMTELLGQESFRVVFGGGSGNMAKVGTILHGWGCKVAYLFDADQGFKNAKQNIKKDWGTVPLESLLKLPVDGAIEDMFSHAEFAELSELPNSEDRNSDRSRSKDKVLPAKKFLERVRSESKPVLSTETNAKWKALFDGVRAQFKGA
jgi:hypothetical protein